MKLQCTKCKKILPSSSFYTSGNLNKARNYHSYHCKDCIKKYRDSYKKTEKHKNAVRRRIYDKVNEFSDWMGSGSIYC